jgi:hypothetical protein
VHLYKVLEVMSTSAYTGLNRSLNAQRLPERTVVSSHMRENYAVTRGQNVRLELRYKRKLS